MRAITKKKKKKWAPFYGCGQSVVLKAKVRKAAFYFKRKGCGERGGLSLGCSAFSPEKLAQAKEENLGLHQTLDQTLNELNCI